MCIRVHVRFLHALLFFSISLFVLCIPRAAAVRYTQSRTDDGETRGSNIIRALFVLDHPAARVLYRVVRCYIILVAYVQRVYNIFGDDRLLERPRGLGE